MRQWQVLNTTTKYGETVLMIAIESKEPAMIKEVIGCVREYIPNPQVIQKHPRR